MPDAQGRRVRWAGKSRSTRPANCAAASRRTCAQRDELTTTAHSTPPQRVPELHRYLHSSNPYLTVVRKQAAEDSNPRDLDSYSSELAALKDLIALKQTTQDLKALQEQESKLAEAAEKELNAYKSATTIVGAFSTAARANGASDLGGQHQCHAAAAASGPHHRR